MKGKRRFTTVPFRSVSIVVRDGVVSVGSIKVGTSLESVVETGEVDVVRGAVTLVVLFFVAEVVYVGVVTITGAGMLIVDEEDDGFSISAAASFSGSSPCVPSSAPSAAGGSSGSMTCVELSVVSPVAVGATKIRESKLEPAEAVGRVATDAEDMGTS